MTLAVPFNAAERAAIERWLAANEVTACPPARRPLGDGDRPYVGGQKLPSYYAGQPEVYAYALGEKVPDRVRRLNMEGKASLCLPPGTTLNCSGKVVKEKP